MVNSEAELLAALSKNFEMEYMVLSEFEIKTCGMVRIRIYINTYILIIIFCKNRQSAFRINSAHYYDIGEVNLGNFYQ